MSMMMYSSERNIPKDKWDKKAKKREIKRMKAKAKNKNRNRKNKKNEISPNLYAYVSLRAELSKQFMGLTKNKINKMAEIEEAMDSIWPNLTIEEQEIANGICFDIKWAENKGKMDLESDSFLNLRKFDLNTIDALEFLRQYPRTIGNKKMALFRARLYRDLGLINIMEIFMDFHKELKEKEKEKEKNGI